MKLLSFGVTNSQQLLLGDSICWTQRKSDTEEMRPPRFGMHWWQPKPLFCWVWNTARWKYIPRTHAKPDQHWDEAAHACLYLEYLESCPCSPPTGFYVVSLPLNQLDMLERAAAGKENYMHITVCCQGTILCWPSRSIWPLPQPPEKKNVCAQSLFYGTQACSKHTVWHLFPRGRAVTNTSCVHTTEHLQVCVIHSPNYSRKPSAGSSASY